MIAPEWTSAIGVAVALSFALGAPLNTARYAVFTRLSNHLARLGCTPVQADDEPLEPLGAEIVVFGMGRVGVGAFDGLATCRGDRILGADRNERIVRMNAAEGRQMIRGRCIRHRVLGTVATRSTHRSCGARYGRPHRKPRSGAAGKGLSSKYPNCCHRFAPDDVRELEEAGVDVARNLYGEAGQGLADDACDLLYRKGLSS